MTASTDLTPEARELIAAAERGDITFWPKPIGHYRRPDEGRFYGQTIYGEGSRLMNRLVDGAYLEVGGQLDGCNAHKVAPTAKGRAEL